MKRHLIISKTIDGFIELYAFSACGIHRAALEPKAETRIKSKVTCFNCQKTRALKGKK